ncbi:MAG: DsbA family oxidoreductase [Azoarcus sp.]|nr:MAG: DsbA family oxidoreductase [Azoarcus sp.]
MLLNIDLVSDFVCPWCYIGKVRLYKAIESLRSEHQTLDFRINWLPYFLNPTTPLAGEPYRAFLEAKFGSAAEVDALHARVAEAGAPDGVHFDFDRIAIRPNTMLAHRLTYGLQARGARQERIRAVTDGVFEAHFKLGKNIGDAEVLADIAAGCGENRERTLAYLESGENLTSVRRMAEQVQKQGISGVPFFIIDRKLALSGAQSSTAIGAAILQALG